MEKITCKSCRGKPKTYRCWFCDDEARGTCAACGRGVCRIHANIHDELTLTKSDTSTGYASPTFGGCMLRIPLCQFGPKSMR